MNSSDSRPPMAMPEIESSSDTTSRDIPAEIVVHLRNQLATTLNRLRAEVQTTGGEPDEFTLGRINTLEAAVSSFDDVLVERIAVPELVGEITVADIVTAPQIITATPDSQA